MDNNSSIVGLLRQLVQAQACEAGLGDQLWLQKRLFTKAYEILLDLCPVSKHTSLSRTCVSGQKPPWREECNVYITLKPCLLHVPPNHAGCLPYAGR